ncbi:MAG: orotate phosphoribosyltransferase [Armatimonadota bacterium]
METVGPASDLPSLRSHLRDLLVERAITYGHFVLASGQTSNYYVDKTQITLMGEGLYCLARVILDQIEGMNVQAVGGMTVGADPIAGAVSALGICHGQHLDAFIVRKRRKERGTRERVEGPLHQGSRVVVLEDVVTTGGSALEAVRAVEEERDAEVVQVLAMVDRLQGGRENIAGAGYDFTALFTVQDLGVKVE